MFRCLIGAFVVVLVLAGAAAAQVCTDDLGVAFTGAMMQPGGGDQDYGDSGMMLGLEIRKLLSDNVTIAVEYRRGVTQGGDEPSTTEAERFSGWGDAENFRTVWNYAGASAIYNFTPDNKVNPFVSLGLGLTFWETQDWRDSATEEGAVADGYNTDGKMKKLEGANLTAVLGAGVELFATDRLAVNVGARYYLLFQNEKDNVGWSAAYGPEFVDANSNILEAYAGLAYYFGAGDCDGDGIIGKADKCWKVPEDFDGFEDDDGCPDYDNDQDGILDVDDKCPDQAEDFDGDADEDGCPDIDRDGDGILDDVDVCPDDPEDFDGYMDKDGCPDPDNDGDGVLDPMDKCPDTPKGVEVDAHGCPKPVATLMAVTVNFDLNSSKLHETAMAKLDALAKALMEDEAYTIEIAGYACDLGSDDYNEKLSDKRALSVEKYLLDKGISEDRVSVVAYGETHPLVPNTDEAHRAQNRRAVITPSHP